MRIAIESNALFTTQAGVARYVRGLLKGLHRVKADDLECFQLAWEVENFGYQQPGRALKTAYRELWWAGRVAPRELQRQRADALHNTVNCLVRPPKGVREVVTLHDLAFLVFPERFRRWSRWRWSKLLERITEADRIICISKFTANEVHRLLGLPFDRMEVIYNGCEFHPDEVLPAESAPEAAIPPEFMLFVGSLEPGKNLALLKETFALARSKGAALPPLVIVGARWEGVASEGPPPRDWHYLGRQPDEVLIYLYRRARAFLFPSKYEGFGLPVAEAMAFGCPVICSRAASISEVGGGAALYRDLTPEGFLNGIVTLIESSALESELRSAGPAQARKFSWSRCAREVSEIYRDVMD